MGMLALIRKILRQRSITEARILVLGLDKAGKTSILRKLTNEPLHDVVPTQGFNINSLLRGQFKLNVWDVGGKDASRRYWRNYCDHIDALVFVVDCSDRERLEESGEELIQFLEEDKQAKYPVLILGNKQDLAQALPEFEIADALSLVLIRDRPWQVQGCSAYTGDGLRDGMNWLMEQLERQLLR